MKHSTSIKRRILLVTVALALTAVFPVKMGWSQSPVTTVSVNPQISTSRVGETFTVNVAVSNVQNLFGLELTVDWNASALQLITANARLGVESYSDGVLHGNRLNYNENSLIPGDIYVEDNSTSQSIGEYHLAAASVGSSDSFNGNGNIVTLTFKVTALGRSWVEISSDLADKPVAGETTSNPIEHNDVGGSVEVVIPEFPAIAAVGLLLVLATAVLMFSGKATKKRLK